jgi:hypothetical protein
MRLEKAVNHSDHGVHGENTESCIVLANPSGQEKQWLFAVSAVSPWLT